MPTSKLRIFNNCLFLLGKQRLSTPDATTVIAEDLRDAYDAVIDLCHESGEWDFAIERKLLNRAEETPTNEYDYYYTLPADTRRVIALYDDDSDRSKITDYKIEVGKVACNCETLYGRVVTDVSYDNPGRWSESFGRYVAAEMAYLLYEQYKPGILKKVLEEIARRKAQALGTDAAQGPIVERPQGAMSRAARGSRVRSSREQAR